jgi:asparagine synthase (glutamine-hydrolysing)
MLAVMASRGPDGTSTWAGDKITLGYGALHATPESVGEQMPLVDRLTGNVVVADVRLDNRPELMNKLGLDGRDASKIGDGRLLLDAYRTWGEDCVDQLLGDFAFAIWDERRQQLFLARDHFGAKPLTYHSSDGLFAFASDSRSVVGLEGVPQMVNRDRVVDFLVEETEWFDTTSTFFEMVHRLPPANTQTISASDRRLRRYWHLPEPETLRLRSDAEYEEATREVLELAVACRLRGATSVGVMLSGGIDSGSIAAMALRQGPVFTYSAVSEDEPCMESSLIRQATGVLPVTPHFAYRSAVHATCGDFMSEQRHRESLFTNGAMPRTLFSLAATDGRRSVLTGVLADEVASLSCGAAMGVFLADRQPLNVLRLLASNGNLGGRKRRIVLARSAIVSTLARNRMAWKARSSLQDRRWRSWKRRHTRTLHLRLDSEEQMRLDRRLDTTQWRSQHSDDAGALRHRLFDRGYGVAALERYDRSAASSSVECRSPFMDRRVVEFFQTLPAQQLISGGWTKSVLRRSMVCRLPTSVVWSRHKQHLGWSFTSEWAGADPKRFLYGLPSNHPLHAYVNVDDLLAAAVHDDDSLDSYLRPACAGLWLEQHQV